MDFVLHHVQGALKDLRLSKRPTVVEEVEAEEDHVIGGHSYIEVLGVTHMRRQ